MFFFENIKGHSKYFIHLRPHAGSFKNYNSFHKRIAYLLFLNLLSFKKNYVSSIFQLTDFLFPNNCLSLSKNYFIQCHCAQYVILNSLNSNEPTIYKVIIVKSDLRVITKYEQEFKF